MTTRMAEEIERDCVELGSEGRLIQLQLDELITELPTEKHTVIYDYHTGGIKDADEAIERLAGYSYQDLLESEFLAQLLGFPRTVNPLDQAVSPRGYRVLSHVPRLTETTVRHVVASFEGLDAIVRATQRELEAVEGVGPARARDIREGLRRLQEHNLVERYLQL
jgi:diadenylate cyclase